MLDKSKKDREEQHKELQLNLCGELLEHAYIKLWMVLSAMSFVLFMWFS